MLKTGIFLLALCATVIWVAAAGADQSHPIVRVVCAVIVSYAIFVAVLLATERKHARHLRSSGSVRTTRIGGHLPPTI